MSWLSEEAILILREGIWVTLFLTVVTSLLSLVVGIGVGTLRLSARPWRRACATIYIELFRNIPALVLIIFLAFAVPNLFPTEWRRALFFDNRLMNLAEQITTLSLPYYGLAAIVALTLNTAAYIAELFRAGVGTIPRSMIEAARTLGASDRVLFWQILLREGIRASFPAITTRLIHNMKNTALASFVAVPEFFHATQASINRTFRAVEFLFLAAVVYLILTAVFSQLLRQIERRFFPSVYV